MTTVGDVLGQLDRWYDPAWAEDWDAVGLVVGDPNAAITAVHVAVDPTEAVAAQTVSLGAELLLTHHPLFLGGTTSLTGPKGRVVDMLHGRALVVAHTNADVARPGVSDALADLLGLTDTTAISPLEQRLEQWVVHIPHAYTEPVLAAMAGAGAGSLGDYDRCAFVGAGTGTFRPLPGSNPFLGRVGRVETVEEDRLEMVAPPGRRDAIARAVQQVHPYEVPSVSVREVVVTTDRGLGRIGTLPETVPLGRFCDLVAERLPATAWGLRATGDPATPIRSVAVAGGACLDLAEAVYGRADVLLTADAKHHRAQETPLPILDAAHWATEWPWTAAVAGRLRERFPDLAVTVCKLVTDPWTQHRAGSAP